MYVRFVDGNFNVRSHFLGNFNAGENDAAIITQCIVTAMQERGISSEKVLGLGSDGQVS